MALYEEEEEENDSLSPYEEALGGRWDEPGSIVTPDAVDVYESGGADFGPSPFDAPPSVGDRESGGSSTTDKPWELPGISDADPTRPVGGTSGPGTTSTNTGAPPSMPGSSDSGGGGGDYTPTRPRQPVSAPGAFASMPQDPTLGTSPSAMSVSMRAPYISSPAQYNPTGGGPRLRSVTGGLTRGGQSVAGADGGPDNVLSSLLRMLLQRSQR